MSPNVRGAGRRVVVTVEATDDTAAAEALIAAAEAELATLDVERTPLDGGLVQMARSQLRTARGSLEIRRRLRSDKRVVDRHVAP